MKNTKIRWSDHTWNPMTGCTRISPGCDNCYADVIASKFAGTPAWPNGFATTFKPHKLKDPARWKTPSRIFVNSMSDLFHQDFTDAQIDEVMNTMVETDRHDYLMLTKRPQRIGSYLDGWLSRTGLAEVPAHIWLGASVENDRYTWRARDIADIPAAVRFLSVEPLLGPVPSLADHLDGIHWVIVGGESGSGFRPMPHEWARDVRDMTRDAGAAFYFKQSAAYRTELGIELDGERIEEFPLPHPTVHQGDRTVGVYPEQPAALFAVDA